jgi:hypothetical protein
LLLGVQGVEGLQWVRLQADEVVLLFKGQQAVLLPGEFVKSGQL